MSNLPSKVEARLLSVLKRFQPILTSARSRDVNESDTVVIVTDLLSELFGYDKYSEVTSEFSIRGTYCDLAIKLQDKLEMLIEVKAIGLDLKDAFVKQAVDYAANQGVDWVVLTNGDLWKVFRITFAKPIEQELVFEFRITELNGRKDDDLEILYLLTKEGMLKQGLNEYHAQKQVLSRYSIAAMVLSEPILDSIRKVLRKITPEIKVDTKQIHTVLTQEVLKRDVTEGEKADEAKKKLNRMMNRLDKLKAEKSSAESVSHVIKGDASQDIENN